MALDCSVVAARRPRDLKCLCLLDESSVSRNSVKGNSKFSSSILVCFFAW
jgi:hypothetical protein